MKADVGIELYIDSFLNWCYNCGSRFVPTFSTNYFPKSNRNAFCLPIHCVYYFLVNTKQFRLFSSVYLLHIHMKCNVQIYSSLFLR